MTNSVVSRYEWLERHHLYAGATMLLEVPAIVAAGDSAFVTPVLICAAWPLVTLYFVRGHLWPVKLE